MPIRQSPKKSSRSRGSNSRSRSRGEARNSESREFSRFHKIFEREEEQIHIRDTDYENGIFDLKMPHKKHGHHDSIETFGINSKEETKTIKFEYDLKLEKQKSS
jgi:hypothetical protein